jgi:hypothetical protein
MDSEIIATLIGSTLILLIFRYFKKQNKQQREQWEGESANRIVIKKFAVIDGKMGHIKSAIILGFFFSLGFFVFIYTLILFDTPDSLVVGTTSEALIFIGESVLFFVQMWGVCSLVSLLVLMPATGKGQTETLPHFLYSRRFSQTEDFTIYVNEFGIDGRFALSWKRVYKLQQSESAITIYYNRRPRWLAKLLQADSFRLKVSDESTAQEISKLWHMSKNT